MTATTTRPLTQVEQTYMELDRLWRHHTALLESMVWCYHGVGSNRRYPQDGCPRCFSNRTIDECERRLNALSREVAA